MNIQKYIQEHGIEALKTELFIEIREYENGFRVFNYSQIDSPKMNPVAQECRGLILDANHNIICRPFSRFFNYGEADTKSFDFSNTTVFEKMDGSLVKCYYNPIDCRWEIATRGTAFAEANHSFGLKTDWTFREAILDAMGFSEEGFQSCMSNFNKKFTYLFEYCSWANRIVTKYDDSFVALLAVIENSTGREFNINTVAMEFIGLGMNCKLPTVYSFESAEQLLAAAETLPNLKEGFVVFDNNTGKRVKIKSSVYCAVHHLRGNGTPSANALIELVLKNEQDELLQYFPEYSVLVEPVELALKELLSDADALYSAHCGLETQKDFALAVKDSKLSAVMFKARRDGISAHKAFYELTISQQKSIIERYLDK